MELDKEIPPEPMPQKWYHVIGYFTFDWEQFTRFFRTNIAHAFGNPNVDFFFWCPLLSKENIKTKRLFAWARFLLIGHAVLAALFIYFELYILIFTVTFGYFFATFLVHGCEVQQHSGLGRNVPDWRVVAYTADFGPIMSYLYWNMNYHIEHHMYASVPFYNLPKLNRVMKADLPYPLKGYWRGLAHVLRMKRRQKADPDYRFMPGFPATGAPPKRATG
jgi:fatty acid desaturase